MEKGTVKSIFITRANGGEVFFHIRDLDRALAFDDTLPGRRVEFVLTQTSRGFSARNVRATA
jgi:cold shock CspA family protein